MRVHGRLSRSDRVHLRGLAEEARRRIGPFVMDEYQGLDAITVMPVYHPYYGRFDGFMTHEGSHEGRVGKPTAAFVRYESGASDVKVGVAIAHELAHTHDYAVRCRAGFPVVLSEEANALWTEFYAEWVTAKAGYPCEIAAEGQPNAATREEFLLGLTQVAPEESPTGEYLLSVRALIARLHDLVWAFPHWTGVELDLDRLFESSWEAYRANGFRITVRASGSDPGVERVVQGDGGS